jgi:hypothetical protein
MNPFLPFFSILSKDLGADGGGGGVFEDKTSAQTIDRPTDAAADLPELPDA